MKDKINLDIKFSITGTKKKGITVCVSSCDETSTMKPIKNSVFFDPHEIETLDKVAKLFNL